MLLLPRIHRLTRCPEISLLAQLRVKSQPDLRLNLTRLLATKSAQPTKLRHGLPNAGTSNLPPPKPFSPPVKPLPRTRPEEKLPPSEQPRSFTGSKGNAIVPPLAGEAYPAQLLIYHAGTGFTVFIAFFKLTAIFVFLFTAVLITPAYYFSPHDPTWMAPISLCIGAIPLGFMVFTTYPFVTYVHLILPQWARLSKDRLQRYVANLPSNTVLDVTTLRWIWPRVTRLHLSELYIPETGLSGRMSGAMSLRRNVPQSVIDARRWYDYRPEKGFLVIGRSGKVAEKFVWPEIMATARKGWLQQQARERAAKAKTRTTPKS